MNPKNAPENCTHPVPENSFGIVAMHCFDNQPIPVDQLKALFDGPMKGVDRVMREEADKVVDVKDLPADCMP